MRSAAPRARRSRAPPACPATSYAAGPVPDPLLRRERGVAVEVDDEQLAVGGPQHLAHVVVAVVGDRPGRGVREGEVHRRGQLAETLGRTGARRRPRPPARPGTRPGTRSSRRSRRAPGRRRSPPAPRSRPASRHSTMPRSRGIAVKPASASRRSRSGAGVRPDQGLGDPLDDHASPTTQESFVWSTSIRRSVAGPPAAARRGCSRNPSGAVGVRRRAARADAAFGRGPERSSRQVRPPRWRRPREARVTARQPRAARWSSPTRSMISAPRRSPSRARIASPVRGRPRPAARCRPAARSTAPSSSSSVKS